VITKTGNVTLILDLFFLVILVLTACTQQANHPTEEQSDSGERRKVVTTTTIVGDVVSQVGGDLIELSVLLPAGVDPHSFDPTPQDIAKVAEADLVFANGAGLENFLDNLIESAGAKEKVIYVSAGIDFLKSEGEQHEHDPVGTEPHTWTDPHHVMVWVDNIERELRELDSENADSYGANAEKYKAELDSLDAWIREQVAQIPVENRKLVTDHAIFGYYAVAYGFEQIGALIPGYSTMAEPTAKELADIEDAVRDLGVKAIFVGNTVNSALAERVVEDTGSRLVFIYTGSLSDPGGNAGTYIEYMRYNTNAFLDALK